MMCTQPPAPQQRTLVLKGTLDLPRSMKLFGKAMPLHSELDGLVRSRHPELVAHKNWLSTRSGDLLLYPEQNGVFPALFEYTDTNTGKRYCIDTRNYMHIKGIALFFPRDTYRFRFDGDKMLFFLEREPVILQFPQHPGWYPYDARTFIPVSSGGISDATGHMTGRFLQRAEGAWLGCPSRDLNRGNNDEKYVFVSDLPSTPRAVFAWEDIIIQSAAQATEPKPRRRIVQVPASAPVSGGQIIPSEPEKPKITYHIFKHEWDLRRALHGLDPAHYSDPGTVPDQKTFETLLREGKIRMEK
ncbi:hypothetical protein H0O01_01235 [Candidatus Micrarchaeota archaeon]|nr:hypothetical protein [Candidatus Micrarchaeota archaeon]